MTAKVVGGDDPRFQVYGTMVLNNAVVDEASVVASDARIKRNITTLDATASAKRIAALRPVSFDYVPDAPVSSRMRGHNLGLVAQEVAKVYGRDSGVVVGAGVHRRPELLGLRYDGIVADLVAVVQQQARELEALKKALKAE